MGASAGAVAIKLDVEYTQLTLRWYMERWHNAGFYAVAGRWLYATITAISGLLLTGTGPDGTPITGPFLETATPAIGQRWRVYHGQDGTYVFEDGY